MAVLGLLAWVEAHRGDLLYSFTALRKGATVSSRRPVFNMTE